MSLASYVCVIPLIFQPSTKWQPTSHKSKITMPSVHNSISLVENRRWRSIKSAMRMVIDLGRQHRSLHRQAAT